MRNNNSEPCTCRIWDGYEEIEGKEEITMNYITGKTSFGVMAPSAVSLGKFDGLHRGHQKLLQHILEQKKNGLEATIFTFASNPTRMLSGLSAQNILTNEERREMLAQSRC